MRLMTISDIAIKCAFDEDFAEEGHDRFVMLENFLRGAQRDLEAYRRQRICRLPPEVTALIIRKIPFSACTFAALCGDRVTYDMAFESAFRKPRSQFYSDLREHKLRSDENSAWVKHELATHPRQSNTAFAVYAVAWGSTSLDDVTDMDACNDETRRVVLVAIKDDDSELRLPLTNLNRFVCLCISQCVLYARHRQSPYTHGGVLQIMDERSIWWVDRVPCAVRRLWSDHPGCAQNSMHVQ